MAPEVGNSSLAAPTQTHEITSTTLISGKPHFSAPDSQQEITDISALQRESSHYLEKMFGGQGQQGNDIKRVTVHIDEANNVVSPDLSARETMIIEDDDNINKLNENRVKRRGSIINDLDPTVLSPSGPTTPSHDRAGSTIQGGFRKFQQQLSEKIVNSLTDATDHRDKILDTLQQFVEEQKTQNNGNNKDDKQMNKALEGINNMRSEVNKIGNKLKEYHNKTIKEIQIMTEKVNNISESTPKPRKSFSKERKINADDDWDKEASKIGKISGSPQAGYGGDEWDKEWDKSQRENYKKKIAELQQEIVRLKDDIKTKDNLIQSQAMNIKQIQMNSTQSDSMDSMKTEILQQMRSQFQSLQNQQQRSKKSSLFDDVKYFDVYILQCTIILKTPYFQHEIDSHSLSMNNLK